MSAPLYGTRPGTSDAGDHTNVTGLAVTSRLVRLDPGLFSLSLVPGPADRGTGLPAVRASLPPTSPGRRDAVSISTFRADGWMTANDEPILFRVLAGGAEVWLTLYWSAADGAPPPSLKLARLHPEGASGPPVDTTGGSQMVGQFGTPATGHLGGPGPGQSGAPAGGIFGGAGGGTLAGPGSGMFPGAGSRMVNEPAARPPAGPAAGLPARPAEVIAHIEGVGDVEGRFGEWVGMRGSGRAIEGFSLSPWQGISPDDFEIRAVLGRDWFSPWLPGGSFCGSRGLALPLRGFSMRLHPAAAARYELACFARFVDGSEIGPVGADRLCAAPNFTSLEAFQVQLRPRAG